jgi:hypothetical protein
MKYSSMFCVIKKKNLRRVVNSTFNNASRVFERMVFYIDIRCFLSMKGVAYNGISVYRVIFPTKKRRDKFIRE